MAEQKSEKHTDSINTNKEKICIRNSDLPRIVIIGGGFAGLSLAKHLKNKKVQVVLIDKNNFNQF